MIGEFRINNGVICNGTMRIARMDYDTAPCDAFKKDVEDLMLRQLNRPEPALAPSKLLDKITHAINCVSAENGSDTPDFILGEYLTDCLAAFDKAVHRREKWYGREPGMLHNLNTEQPAVSDLLPPRVLPEFVNMVSPSLEPDPDNPGRVLLPEFEPCGCQLSNKEFLDQMLTRQYKKNINIPSIGEGEHV